MRENKIVVENLGTPPKIFTCIQQYF